MEENIKIKVNDAIKSIDMWVDSVYTSVEEGITNLNIVLDSNDVIDVDRITEASKIINPIIDKLDINLENFVLDIHSKEKGSIENE